MTIKSYEHHHVEIHRETVITEGSDWNYLNPHSHLHRPLAITRDRKSKTPYTGSGRCKNTPLSVVGRVPHCLPQDGQQFERFT